MVVLAERAEKDVSRKDAKAPSFGETRKTLSLRLGGATFLAVVFSNVSDRRI
jgi:hypothetical protein